MYTPGQGRRKHRDLYERGKILLICTLLYIKMF